MLQRGVGNDAAVPEMIGADLETIGSAGGNAPLAITCSGPITSFLLSK
jgi:hypothetical protein